MTEADEVSVPTPGKRICRDCGQNSPAVQTAYTLISSVHGWRLTKVEVNGVKEMQWRCPECYKKTQGQVKKVAAKK